MLASTVFLIVLLGSFLQANIGFGFPIIAMMFFPYLFPFSTAVTLNQIIALGSTSLLTIKYWKYIQWKTLFSIVIPSIVLGTLVILLSLSVSSRSLSIFLGISLVCLSLYFAFFSSRITIKPTIKNGVTMGLIAGLGNGLFGIGGPPVALYLFAAVKGKQEYLATIQAYFLLCNVHSILMRTLHGSLTLEHIPLILVGWIAIFTGTFLGLSLFKRISDHLLRRIVYSFVGISGIWIVVQQLIHHA
jgi:hypothetical protein